MGWPVAHFMGFVPKIKTWLILTEEFPGLSGFTRLARISAGFLAALLPAEIRISHNLRHTLLTQFRRVTRCLRYAKQLH